MVVLFFEKFTAEFSASAPVVYKNPPHMGPEILYTTGAGEMGSKREGNNNKLYFLWPKMARLVPLLWAQNPSEKAYVDPFFASFPKMRQINFFLVP